jgi:membrane glycosyltransferase
MAGPPKMAVALSTASASADVAALHCWRPRLFLLLVMATAAAGVGLLADSLAADGLAPLEVAIIVLFALNFSWIAMSFWTACIGFCVRMFAPSATALPNGLIESDALLRARGAIVMPIYNEDTARIFAGLEAIYRSLAKSPEAAAFDLFILSDSTSAECAAAERAAWRRLCARVGGAGHIFYRRRHKNTGRKAGNIADFCRRWGGHYEYMLILDADSIMAGRTIVRLARLMEANPKAGIIQTLPVAVGSRTLFGRIVQFANRLYGPLLASGLSFWHGSSATYWGHNAMIRVSAFVAHCGLPTLPGRAPLGGEILSHDFVEAALIKRGGWDVWLLPDVDGSYEEVPSNPLDYARRDRRWCQGNLQHMRLIGARGFTLLSRTHFVMGVMAYLSSLLWLLLLLLSTAEMLAQGLTPQGSTWPGFPFFPVWPESKAPELLALFGITLAMLFLPKILAAVRVLVAAELRRQYGGAAAVLGGIVIETVFSALRAPPMMMFHSQFVLSILLGRDSGWATQQRGERGIGVSEAVARQGLHTASGAAWAVLVFTVVPVFGWWLAPVLAGLLLSVPLTMLASRSRPAEALRRSGLLVTPEDIAPPAALVTLDAMLPLWQPVSAGRARRMETGAADRVRAPLSPTPRMPAGRPRRPRLPDRPAPRPRPMPVQRLDYPSLPWRLWGRDNQPGQAR